MDPAGPESRRDLDHWYNYVFGRTCIVRYAQSLYPSSVVLSLLYLLSIIHSFTYRLFVLQAAIENRAGLLLHGVSAGKELMYYDVLATAVTLSTYTLGNLGHFTPLKGVVNTVFTIRSSLQG